LYLLSSSSGSYIDSKFEAAPVEEGDHCASYSDQYGNVRGGIVRVSEVPHPAESDPAE
jgi:hypothetical protein